MRKRENDILVPNELSSDAKASMRTRIISGIVAAILIIPPIILGDYFHLVLVGILAMIGTFEIVHCAKKKYNPTLYIVAILLALLMTYWPLIRSIPQYFGSNASFTDWTLYKVFFDLWISPLVIGLGAFAVFFMVIIDKGFTVRDACFMFTMIVIITLGFQSALYLRYLPSLYYHNLPDSPSVGFFNLYDNLESSLLLLYVIFATTMTDIGAYFIGVFFGKHKMNPRISPKKTWEGFVGGIVISSAFSFGVSMILFATGHPYIKGLLDLHHWYLILILSLILPLVSTLGDFVFSSSKRHFEIKDFGNIMPGHGGVLDRLDSLLFSFITTAVFLEMIEYWGPFVK